tara:strand:- start:169 stop:438 length:270 start_codon:yes stop_codon:yes gene_type:complete
MSRQQRIEGLLIKAFSPQKITIIDESHLHQHHREGGGLETHFKISIRSSQFNGVSLLQRHRLVNQVLKEEFKTGLHALSLDVWDTLSHE